MATGTFHPGRLKGVATVPPAKSEAHRALLLAALGRETCRLNGFAPPLCDDTQAMVNGVTALGAAVVCEDDALIVTPAPDAPCSAEPVDCEVHACAAALRMLIPAFLSRGRAVRFTMEDGLFARPCLPFSRWSTSSARSFAASPPGKAARGRSRCPAFCPRRVRDRWVAVQPVRLGLLIARPTRATRRGTPPGRHCGLRSPSSAAPIWT